MKFHKGMIRFNSPVVLMFTFLSLAAFLLNIITRGAANRFVFSIHRTSLLDPLFYIRMVMHVFGHLDWEHLSGNMMYLLLLGPLLEEKYGSLHICVVCFLTAVITGIFHVLFFKTALLGASGVVFAFIILSSITSMRDRKIPLTFLIVVVIYLGGEIINGVFLRDNVSNLTHILGGIVGGVCGYGLNNRKYGRVG